jgi:hypothetical protein
MKNILRSYKLFQLILFLLFFIPFITDAQWSNSIKLSVNGMNASLNENSGPCLAVNGDTVNVVWTDHRTNGYAIYYIRSTDKGITWNTAVPLTDTTGKASMPVIAVSGSSVHVVWMDTIAGIRVSDYKRSLDGGNTWGPDVLLDNNTKFWPGVATSGSRVYVTLNKEVASGNTEVFLVRSFDNGNTWQAEQKLSNASGRSEDPAISVQGADVHLSWNDNRSGVMEIYYIHSSDYGETWGPETPLSFGDSYSSMVCLNGTHVDIPFGFRISGDFDVYLRQSQDTGSTFDPAQQLSNSTNGDAYPFLVRDGNNLHMVYMQFSNPAGSFYLHSGDGGTTWDPALFIGNGYQPFIAYTGCVLHVIWPDSGVIYYKRNPTGNCNYPAGIENNDGASGSSLSVFPNPASNSVKVYLPDQKFYIETIDITGKSIFHSDNIPGITEINCRNLPDGVYFIKATTITGQIFSRKLIIIR